MTGLRIALASPAITKDIRQNGRIIRDAMERAAAGGARLVQFPEGALSGYAKQQITTWAGFDQAAQDEELAAIADLAGALGIWAVVGGADHFDPDQPPHNSLFIISDKGQKVACYDKQQCSHSETSMGFYTPGKSDSGPVTITVDGYTFGFLLCLEIHFPHLVAVYAALNVDAILLSAYSPTDHVESWPIEARGHAAMNAIWFGLTNPANRVAYLPPLLAGPDGAVLAQGNVGDDLLFGVLDRHDPALDMALNKARPWRRRMARDGIDRPTGKA